MIRSIPIRLAGLLLAATTSMLAQAKPSAAIPITSSLPATPTTTVAPERSKTPGELPPHRAVVSYKEGRLAVLASNSSLNQILRDVARQTGMKITGGVMDERVFGSYGPDDPATVLAALLDGSGSNMLLIAGSTTVANELVLTPRLGGPTPPSPSALAPADDEESAPEKVDRPPDSIRPDPRLQGAGDDNKPVMAIVPAPISAPVANDAPASAATTPSADTSTTTQEQSPNGVKTPQQIYEQLMKMQQKPSGP